MDKIEDLSAQPHPDWFAAYMLFLNNTQPGARARETETGLFQCPCCLAYTLSEPGGYDICDICGWEDDGETEETPNLYGGGPNGQDTLLDARANVQRWGNVFDPVQDADRHQAWVVYKREWLEQGPSYQESVQRAQAWRPNPPPEKGADHANRW